MYQNDTTPRDPADADEDERRAALEDDAEEVAEAVDAGRQPVPRREIAATIRTSCAVFEMRTIVSRSMKVERVRSTHFWTARPPSRQKRKSGSTESRLDFWRKDPLGNTSSIATTGSRST